MLFVDLAWRIIERDEFQFSRYLTREGFFPLSLENLRHTDPLHSDIQSNVCQEQRTTDKWV